MKRLSGWILRLYPAGWRERYGDEMTALLEDAPPRGKDLFDLFQGALTMQLTQRSLPKVVAGFAVFGLLAGVLTAYSIRDVYLSAATIALPPGAPLAKAALPPASDRSRISVVRRTLESGARQEVLAVYYRDHDRAVAVRTARTLSTDLARQFGGTILDEAATPTSPILPNRPVVSFAGLLAGLALSLPAALVIRRRRATNAPAPPA